MNESILKLLESEHIFDITKTEYGFIFTEECDRYHSFALNKEQMLKLSKEIEDLANS